MKSYTFFAQPERRPATAHADSPQEAEPYLASPALIRAVNLAIYLRRPLLLEGEAGSGKSSLARAVAYELGLPFYAWYIRSTSKAQEGLYTYDAILRLHDVQTAKVAATLGGRDPSRATDYRTFGALGKAFALKACPAVVLIDEIDKADVDFPNDLLAVLDDPWAFDIPETGEQGARRIEATHPPIVMITSNKEKGNLPAPFLRRCIYYFIEFPNDAQQLARIVQLHAALRNQAGPEPALIQAAAQRFLALRRQDLLHKKPGTSEFLDWLQALQHFNPAAPYAVEALQQDDQPLPYPELLFKLRMDWQRFAEAGA
jgi:MoxR-like ATPase